MILTYLIYHYLDSQMYFNYSSSLIHLSFSLKKDFVIFDHLFITLGFITIWILRCILIFISLLIYWTRRHLLEMTRAYVLYFPAAAAAPTATPIFPN